jgi:hypothetical protein
MTVRYVRGSWIGLALLIAAMLVTASPGYSMSIGGDSCKPDVTKACKGNTGNIGEDSCSGGISCDGNRGTIGDGSCMAPLLARPMRVVLETIPAKQISHASITPLKSARGSCDGEQACLPDSRTSNQDSVGDGSCDGEFACRERSFSIGNNSCNGRNACSDDIGTSDQDAVGDGDYACSRITTRLP